MFIYVFMNTCWGPHFEISPVKRFTVAAIILFSTSKQTHCVLIVCDSD